MIATLATAGLRRAELVALDVEHFNTETGELRVIAGKGMPFPVPKTPPRPGRPIGR